MSGGISKSVRLSIRGLTVLIVLLAAASAPAFAQEQVKIGIGYGLAFLPIYICEDLKLVEKRTREAHLDVKASYERFDGAGPLQDAMASGTIDIGPFGIAPLLTAWEQAKNTPRQILAVSGMTTLPLALLTNQPNVESIADLKPADRIALPTLSSPQMYLLEMQSERTFGQFDRLRSQVVALWHGEAIAALVGRAGPVTAYFSSPPFTQIALRDPRLHRLLSSEEVMGGKASFLILGASRSYIETHAKIAEAIGKAMDDAARIIRDDPRRAGQIYLAHEPSRALDSAEIDAVLKENKDEFGSAVHGVQAFADFMGRHGELKAPPQSWKEIVAPALLSSPGS